MVWTWTRVFTTVWSTCTVFTPSLASLGKTKTKNCFCWNVVNEGFLLVWFPHRWMQSLLWCVCVFDVEVNSGYSSLTGTHAHIQRRTHTPSLTFWFFQLIHNSCPISASSLFHPSLSVCSSSVSAFSLPGLSTPLYNSLWFLPLVLFLSTPVRFVGVNLSFACTLSSGCVQK